MQNGHEAEPEHLSDAEEEYRAEFSSLVESLRRVRYWVDYGGRDIEGEEEEGEPEPENTDDAIPTGVWVLCREYVEPVLKVAEPYPLEASLLAILYETCRQLVDATNRAAPERRALPLDALPLDVYKRWNVACLVLMALWDSEGSPEYLPWDLAHVLKEDSGALARAGLSLSDLPYHLQVLLVKLPSFVKDADPPVVQGIQRVYQSKRNAEAVMAVLWRKPFPASPKSWSRFEPWLHENLPDRPREKVFASDAEALQAPLTDGDIVAPDLPPVVRIVEDEPPLTETQLQERVEAVRRAWHEQGIEDDFLLV